MSSTRRIRRARSLLVLALASACGGDVVDQPSGASGGVGGAGATGTAGSTSTASGSSTSSQSSGGGSIASSASSTAATTSTGAEVHTMCFKPGPGEACPGPDEAGFALCADCGSGKGCSFFGEILSGPVFENGMCCYEVTGDCVPNP